MAGLWDSIKDQATTARDIANGDVETVEDPVRGAPIRVRRTEGLRFKPVNPDYQNVVVAVEEDETEALEASGLNAQRLRDAVEQLAANDSEEPRASVTLENQSQLLPVDDFSDLIGDLSIAEREDRRGRPRKFASDAERQKAYRERKVKLKKRAKRK